MLYNGYIYITIDDEEYECIFYLELSIKLSKGDTLNFGSIGDVKVKEVSFFTGTGSGEAYLQMEDVKCEGTLEDWGITLLKEFHNYYLKEKCLQLNF